MSGFDDLAQFFENPEEIMRQHQEQMAKAQELQRQLLELKGFAQSEDERIQVTFSEGNGVEDLTLDPRALRMPSEDLAAEIRRLTNEARADVQRKAQEQAQSIWGEEMADPAAMVENLPKMQEQIDELLRDTRDIGNNFEDVAERMQRMFPDEAR